MENKTPTIIEQPNELVTIAKESGIELSKAEQITLKYVPFLLKIREAEQDSSKINFENPTELDEKIAREIRLKLVPNRTGADKFKKEEKAEAALLNGLHDGAFKIVENASKLLELKLEQVEKQREIQAKARIEALRIERVELIKPYGENYTTMALGDMDATMFDSILNGAKLAYEAKIKAEAEILEAKRQEDLKAKEMQRRKDALIIGGFAFDGNNYFVSDFKRLDQGTIIMLSEKDFEDTLNAGKIEIERLAKLESDKLEKLKAENEAKEKQLEIERIESAKIIADQKSASDKLAAELKAKDDAELKEKQRIEAEQKAKELADKKSAKAPDKEKLTKWIDSFVFPHCLPIESIEANEVCKLIIEKRNSFIKWANDQINAL